MAAQPAASAGMWKHTLSCPQRCLAGTARELPLCMNWQRQCASKKASEGQQRALHLAGPEVRVPPRPRGGRRRARCAAAARRPPSEVERLLPWGVICIRLKLDNRGVLLQQRVAGGPAAFQSGVGRREELCVLLRENKQTQAEGSKPQCRGWG